ncbi:hypothetical protein [Longimicrobium sp.]|jgi:hypothetical protein|uniref:hypothetical protein n=1 Tax=Longimicrobium sp. TaxID=2029185 RepID=UPI002EDAE02E
MNEPTILSLEGWMELMDEMSKPPADTPERRATFERVRTMRAVRERLEREERACTEAR